MKKILIVPIALGTFILGVLMSELVIKGFNAIFDAEITTKSQLKEQLTKNEAQLADMKTKLEAADKKFVALNNQVTKKEANLNSLIKEIDSQVNSEMVKNTILSAPSGDTGKKGTIFLNPGGTESLLETTTSDDPTVNAFKNAFNKKAKDIIDVSKSILKEKTGRLNQEVLRINDELKNRNVQLIGKLKEEEKLKNRIGTLNNELTSTNDQLTSKNQELNAKLKEVEKYKKELEEHRKHINDLEGIKKDLQKTVGVLETKIEDGRLKVSFKGDILFESGDHGLRAEGKQVLDSVFTILKNNVVNNDIFIAGHTDNVPIRPDALDRYASNWVLSTFRAIEVVKYLNGKGLPPRSMTAAGYGEYKPIANNATPEGKAKNRRVELFLMPKIIKRK